MENEMALTLKVLWSEGLALDAQHFQQSDRYHESRLQHMAAAIQPFFWGVQQARWAIDGVGNSYLHAHALTLIFRDGEIYQAPLSDELPLPVDLKRLPAGEQSYVFYAALPMAKAHGGNLSGNGDRRDDRRYAMIDEETPDLYSDGLNVNVTFMTKTVRLLSHFDVRDGYDCIPVVRVRRRGDNSFEIDPTFMPPSVSIEANPALQEMLRGLVGKLTAKCESLYRLQRQPRGHVIEMTSGGAASFWMLSTAMTASASLAHIDKSPHLSPEHLFENLRTLAGGLMAFSRKYGINDLPGYDHENPAPRISNLERHHSRAARYRRLLEIHFHPIDR
jgi:type VI secretion system protein ImpJ